MKIFYPYSEILPSQKARALQVINTCHALAGAGVDIRLCAGFKKAGPDILASYGLRPVPNFTCVPLPILREFSLFGFKLSWERIFKRSFISYFKKENGDVLIRSRPQNRSLQAADEAWPLSIPLQETSGFSPKSVIYTRHLKIAFSLLKKIPHLPLIYEVHEIFSLEKKSLSPLEDFVITNSGGLVFISHNLRKKAEELFPLKAPSVVIPDGVNLELIEESREKALSGEVVYVGQLYPWKGVKNLVRAMAYLPAVKLTIVGGGSNKEKEDIEKMLDELKLRDRVKLTGFLPYGEALRFMTGAKVLVLPLEDKVIARYFTSPLKLFEYMASRAPIVASDLPTIREILTPDETGLLVKPGDEKALATAIDKLLKDPSLARAMADKAYNLSCEYSWKKRAERIIHFIRENLCA